MRWSSRIIIVVAILVIGTGSYGIYYTSAFGSKGSIEGTIVEVNPHLGVRPTCSRRRCFTPDSEEDYTYYTEVVEFSGPDGVHRAEDPDPQNGSHHAVGEKVRVRVRPGGAVDISSKGSLLVSIGFLLVGLGLLSIVVLAERARRRRAQLRPPPAPDLADILYRL